MQHSAAQCSTVQHSAKEGRWQWHHTATLCSTVQHSAMQHITVRLMGDGSSNAQKKLTRKKVERARIRQRDVQNLNKYPFKLTREPFAQNTSILSNFARRAVLFALSQRFFVSILFCALPLPSPISRTVMRCIALCCTVLQSVAVCCHCHRPSFTLCCTVLHYAALCCTVLHCAAVCCTVL